MARRRRRFFTPLNVRSETYDAALEPGLEKFKAKKDIMVDHYAGVIKAEAVKGGAGFSALLDQIIAEFLDKIGVLGQARVGYYVIGRRVGKFVANYASAPDDVIRRYVEQIVRGYIVKEPLVDETAVRELVNELIRRRQELRQAYGLG